MNWQIVAGIIAGLSVSIASNAASLQVAIASFDQGDYGSAKTLLEADLKEVRAQKNLVAENEALYYLGRTYFQLGDLEKAKDTLTEAIELQPNTSDEYYWLGVAYGQLAQRASILKRASYAMSTRKYFQQAVDANPNNVEAHKGLFDFYILAPSIMGGSDEKAEKTLTDIRAFSPADADIKELSWLRKKEDNDAAVSKARALVAKYPENAEAALMSGLTIRDQKKSDDADINAKHFVEAIAAFELAMKAPVTKKNQRFVESARYRFAETCSWIKIRTDEAIQVMEKIVASKAGDKRFNNNWPTWTLAKLYKNKGDMEKFTALRKQLNPELIKQDKRLRDDLERHGVAL